VNPSVSEHDQELLETYLDNELLGEERDQMRARLRREPALAAALEQLTRDRQLRYQAFFAMDREVAATAGASTEQIARSLRQAAVREVAWSNRRSIFRQLSAAAACIVVGLLVGWFGRERAEFRLADPAERGMRQPDISGADAVQVSNEKTLAGFNVAITDDSGRVLAQQHFNTLDEARQFSSDLLRWQTRQREMRNGGGDVRLIGGKF
jgi:anti-sigma factor RsiW